MDFFTEINSNRQLELDLEYKELKDMLVKL